MELRNQTVSQADPVQAWRRQQRPHRQGEVGASAAESKTLSMRGNSKRENRESPAVSESFDADRSANALGGTADVHVAGQSDGSVVPTKLANNEGAEPSAESAEERDPTQRNTEQDALDRTQSRVLRRSSGLSGVREAARRPISMGARSQLKFTALLHHVDEDCLTEAFFHLKKTAAVGIDGVTWHEYEQNLEANIRDLHGRVHRGAYRAKPSRRVWIPKPDGRQRPLGIASLEDKIVQQAVLWVLQSIYEQAFLGFSYGFRPGRSCHQALDALWVGLVSKRVNWVLDADLEGFFDTIDHTWLIKFLEHRIGDRRILRLIRKWLRAGISEEGRWSETKVGTPQGAVISPLLANVFLHYVFDLWIEWWRKNRCRGDVVVVRYADDFVIGFEHKSEAQACLEALRDRFAKFGLKLHPAKTRLIEFGRFAAERRKRRGERRPETFDFLGFTHVCGNTRSHGWFTIRRYTVAKRMRATLSAIREQLRKRWHHPVGETARWLRSVVQGWLNYHAVPDNSRRLSRFVDEVSKLWLQALRRRSQRAKQRWTWSRMYRLVRQHLPRPHVLHPYPNERFRARLKVGAV
jgi:RNA-directed DNA polymerase